MAIGRWDVRRRRRRRRGEQAMRERENKKYLMSRHIVRISFIFKFDIALNMFLENRLNKREYRYWYAHILFYHTFCWKFLFLNLLFLLLYFITLKVFFKYFRAHSMFEFLVEMICTILQNKLIWYVTMYLILR